MWLSRIGLSSKYLAVASCRLLCGPGERWAKGETVGTVSLMPGWVKRGTVQLGLPRLLFCVLQA